MTYTFSFFSLDEDDEAERNIVPLAPLDSLFSDTDSLKPQKKKKAKKIKEGKMPKVKKRKKEVRDNSQSTATWLDPGHTAAWQEVQSPLFSAVVWKVDFSQQGCKREAVAHRGGWQPCQPYCHTKPWVLRSRLENRFKHVALSLMAASGGHSGAMRQACCGPLRQQSKGSTSREKTAPDQSFNKVLWLLKVLWRQIIIQSRWRNVKRGIISTRWATGLSILHSFQNCEVCIQYHQGAPSAVHLYCW